MKVPRAAHRRLLGASVVALLAVLCVPAVAFAHPLGNFTINHYAGLRVSSTAISIDVVIDEAELPTFTERQRIDGDGDGSVSDEEIEAERLVACDRLVASLHLTVDGKAETLVAFAAGISMPPGAAGLSTMRTVCEYNAPISGLDRGVTVGFDDSSFAQRIGWREIRVLGDGTTVSDGATTSADGRRASGADLSVDLGSGRLTHYPASLIAQPPAVTGVTFRVQAGGPSLPTFAAPDASPLPGVVQPTPSTPAASPTPVGIGSINLPVGSAVPSVAPIPGSASVPVGAVPGGTQDQIAGLLETKDLSPLALIGSLLLAAGLGALHAVSPGHGKTVMAAYLVGSRGSARHAAALGLTVTVSHTLGVLALALVALFAAQLIPPERLYPILGFASGATVVGIGLWLLVGRLRIMRRARADAQAHAHEHESEHGHEDAHAHGQEHPHPHDHPHESPVAAAGEHSHGGIRHSHVPSRGDLTWRSLFALGLAGGLVPSASALLLLLGSFAANRAGYGLVLVIAFGAGMAIVLAGIGLALVYASRLIERLPRNSSLGRAWELVPLATALVVVVAGLYLTSQSLLVTF